MGKGQRLPGNLHCDGVGLACDFRVNCKRVKAWRKD